MAAPISTALPTAPSASDAPSVFEEKAFAFVGALEPFRVELQAQADFVSDNVGPGSDAETVANIAADVTTVAAVAPDVSLLAVGQVSKTELEADGGADLVGWKGSTVGEKLDALEFSSSFVPAIIPNNADAANRDIIIMGDSISHGAFALNTFKHGWARIFQRMINAEVGSQSYGFTNLFTLGSGPTATTEIHSVSFLGSWSAVAVDSEQASASLAGFALRSPEVSSGITINLPLFQKRGGIYYIQQPGGGTFTITVNGVLVATVDTDGALSQQEERFNLSDNGYGAAQIIISQTGAGIVDIVGPAYYSGVIEPTVHNFSTSGRRLRNTGEAAIISAMQRASTFVLALGHNDSYDCANNPVYLAEFTQRIDWVIQYADQYNVKVIIADFCWAAENDNPARVQLRRSATETSGRYVDLPGMIASNGVLPTGSYLIDTLKMWADGSHPNKFGMQWIAETISRSIGLSCCSKKDALDFHDYWMPVPLKAATGVENAVALSPSMYRKNGGSIVLYFYIEAAPGGAFPIGSYSLSDGFNAKSELSARSSSTQIATINQTTGDIVSFVTTATSGAVTLNVLAAYINDISFVVTLPA